MEMLNFTLKSVGENTVNKNEMPEIPGSLALPIPGSFYFFLF